MSTPFADVYEIFLNKITDYKLKEMLPADIEYDMSTWLRSATTKFSITCKQNILARDFTLKVFVADLTDLEKEILAGLMIVEWLSPRLNSSQLLLQTATDKDFKIHSQANHIEQLMKLRDAERRVMDSLIMRYGWQSADMSTFL